MKGLHLPKWNKRVSLGNWKFKHGITLTTRETSTRKKQKTTGDFLHMLKGLAVALALTCIVFVAYGMCLTYTDIHMDHLPVVSLVCTALSAAVAGFDWAKCKKKRSLFWGMGAGVCYAILLFLLTSIGSNTVIFSLSKLMTLVVAICGGGLGGVLANFIKH